jgi:hypothetical protein
MSKEDPEGPRALYRERLARRREQHVRYEQRDLRLSILRGLTAVVGIGACTAAMTSSRLGAAALVLSVIVFGALAFAHERVARARERVARSVSLYEAALLRLNDEWAGRGETGDRFLDPSHPYAGDLDLFGRGGVFERLCTARTRAGEETLAAWLLAPASPAVVAERHAAVDELRPRLDLREDLAVLGAEARRSLESSSLRAWVMAPVGDVPAWVRAVGVALSAAAFAALWSWSVGATSAYPLLIALAVIGAVLRWAQQWTEPITRGIDQPARDLETLADLMARLEREPVAALRLARLWAAFRGGRGRPSAEIARLRRLVELRDSKRNLYFAPFAFALLWDVHIAAAVSRWRREAGARVAAAIDALGEIEALCALAAYSFENPSDVFPAFVEEGPRLEAEAIGHPLIPESRCVRNDVTFGPERRLMVVSGSNMSGKSTFLRAVGVNAVLAQMGAPVRARSLRLSPLAVGASIRIVDSLQEGRSRFYAEILRVRQILDMAGKPWLLFLLDEIFHGTNSADRRVGAEAVVRTLVRRDAIGLVTSHDLALTAIADDLAPRAANVHFEDHLEGDKIAFDYRLKPGPVTRSNAVALMRAVGLEV